MYVLLSEFTDNSENVHLMVQIRDDSFRLITTFHARNYEQKLREENLSEYVNAVADLISRGEVGKLYKIDI